jgi:predicted PurR-regulated permease PerM
MTTTPPVSSSPKWSSTTKLVVGLTLAALLIVLLFSIRSVLGPLLVAFILAYYLYPVATQFSNWLHLPWRVTVTAMFLLLIISMIGLLTWSGITILEQFQGLIKFLENSVSNLPQVITDLSAKPLEIGPFVFDLSRLDLPTLIGQLLGVVQPFITETGNLVGTFASSAVSIIGWTFFALIIAYFLLAETGGESRRFFQIDVPGYSADLKRFTLELGYIWKAYLRGQLSIFLLVSVIYGILLWVLGIRYFFGLALLSGFVRFLPYIGAFIVWPTYWIVAYFQGYTLFNVSPVTYAFIILGVTWITDAILDNMVSPRIFSNALRIHPAALMVAALIGLNFMGFIGVVLAGPVFATFKLGTDYATRKMLDLDPWGGLVKPPLPSYGLMLRNNWKWLVKTYHNLVTWGRRRLATLRKG